MDSSSENLLSMPLNRLVQTALETKLRHRGVSFSLCTIMNAKSGMCTEDCAFCTQSARYRTGSPVYPLVSADEAVKQAVAAEQAGAARFSLVTSGRGPDHEEVEQIARMVEEIRDNSSISVCCSLGIADVGMLRRLKEAGVSRYHHNIESSERFFGKICSSHRFEERIATIHAAHEAGLEVCAGGIIGLGEDAADRLSMAETLSGLPVVSVPVNILVPLPGTPLEGARPLAMQEIIRAIAMFRILLPHASIRLAGGRESALGDFLGLACMAGADGMLTGGYLTVRGRDCSDDIRFVQDIRALWKNWSGK